MLLTPAQIKPKSFESRRNSFFTPGGCASCLRACLGARLLPQSYQYPNLWKGADRVGGQLRRDKECPFSGVTKSGRVWRKVPESRARSVVGAHTPRIAFLHLPLNSVRTRCTTEGALFISAQLSTDSVHRPPTLSAPSERSAY